MKRQRGDYECGRDGETEEFALPIPRHRLSQECNAKHHDHHLGELVLELVEVVDDKPVMSENWSDPQAAAR
jgi:hypothetical protein